MAHSGEMAVFGCHTWRQRRVDCWDAVFQAQDKALVFCLRDADDTAFAAGFGGGCLAFGLERFNTAKQQMAGRPDTPLYIISGIKSDVSNRRWAVGAANAIRRDKVSGGLHETYFYSFFLCRSFAF